MINLLSEFKNKENLGKILFIISILMIFFMMYLIFNKYYITNDEYFTLGLIKLPIGYGIEITSMDVHPPLYYLIVIGIGGLFSLLNFNYDIILFSKLISIVPFIIILIVSYLFLKKEFNWFTVGLFTFSLVFMSNFFINYITMRMYSWSILFLLLSFITLYYLLKNPKNEYWVLFTIFTICGIYTHYFNALSSVILYFLLLFYLIYEKFDVKKWFISTFIVILSYVPWIPILINQLNRVNNGYWIPQLNIQTVYNYLAYSFTTSESFLIQLLAIFTLLLLIFIILKNYNNYKDYEKFYYATGILVFLLTLFVGIVISLINEPILYDRYLLPSISLIYLIMSILMGKLKNNKIILILLLFLLVFSAVNIVDELDNVNNYHQKTIKHIDIFNDINNESNIVIFKNSISLLRFDSYLNNTQVYCIKNRYDNNLHNVINFTEINENDLKLILQKNHDKKIYYISNKGFENHNNEKIVHLFSKMYIYRLNR